MTLPLQQFLSVLVVLAVVLLATWCLGVIAWQFCRWLPTVALWRLRRMTIMVLMTVAAVAATSWFFSSANTVARRMVEHVSVIGGRCYHSTLMPSSTRLINGKEMVRVSIRLELLI